MNHEDIKRHLAETVSQAFRHAETSAAAYRNAVGKTIASVSIDAASEALVIALDDGSRLRLFDNEQLCCEKRYMRCDDDLNDFDGATLRYIETRKIQTPPADEEHEIQCVIVHTSKGDITLFNHNEHNGYYGGFDLTATEEKASE